jgi:hypothetical protein
MTWAQRLKRVFKIELENCENCRDCRRAVWIGARSGRPTAMPGADSGTPPRAAGGVLGEKLRGMGRFAVWLTTAGPGIPLVPAFRRHHRPRGPGTGFREGPLFDLYSILRS